MFQNTAPHLALVLGYIVSCFYIILLFNNLFFFHPQIALERLQRRKEASEFCGEIVSGLFDVSHNRRVYYLASNLCYWVEKKLVSMYIIPG